MAYIRTIPPNKARGRLAEAYQEAYTIMGNRRVPKVIQVASLRPNSLIRINRIYELSMWMTDLPRENVEFTAAAVSRLNQCRY